MHLLQRQKEMQIVAIEMYRYVLMLSVRVTVDKLFSQQLHLLVCQCDKVPPTEDRPKQKYGH
jgi:hypothetical protein